VTTQKISKLAIVIWTLAICLVLSIILGGWYRLSSMRRFDDYLIDRLVKTQSELREAQSARSMCNAEIAMKTKWLEAASAERKDAQQKLDACNQRAQSCK
jgi:hypothetical protein